MDLRCEYQTNPLGIDTAQPRLSWRLESDVQGQKQTAYRILVASSPNKLNADQGDLWDSGKVDSDQSQHIKYKGVQLPEKSYCFWKVRVWDKEGKASSWSEQRRWNMGLLKPEDWSGTWISPPDWESDPTKLSIQKAVYRTRNGKESTDVTGLFSRLLNETGTVSVDNKTLGGEGKKKELTVDYTFDGKKGRLLFKQNKKTSVPDFDPRSNPAPLFRKEFDLKAAPSSALVTVHSPAYYELYINGTKVGDDVLTPAISRAGVRSFYVTYDIAKHLRAGRNCIGLWMGKGWADHIVVRAQLDAVVGGKPVSIGTDASWKASRSGIYKIGRWKWGDFGGELIDARELVADWSQPGFDAQSWEPVTQAKAVAGNVRRQPCPLNRIDKIIPAQRVTPLGNGRYEVDFGTALTGWLRYKMPKLPSGTTVTMTFADAKQTEETVKYEPFGKDAWYQTFMQISRFVSAGKANEVFEHKFSYSAFRYVIIDGLPGAPVKEDLSAMLVDSALEDAGSFECSNELFNRIHQVNKWTQRCLNLGGYYVDCPHRERRGYGDGQVATEGFMSNFRADGYYRKWMGDWRDAQQKDGKLPNTAPSGTGGGGPGWGGLLSGITWRHYLYYGDVRILKENYDAVRRYVEYLEKISRNNGGILTGKVGKYNFIGDWVAPRRGMDTKNAPSHEAREVFNNCYRIN